MNFRTGFPISAKKKKSQDFDRDSIKSEIVLGSIDIFTILSLPVREHGASSHLVMSSISFNSVL